MAPLLVLALFGLGLAWLVKAARVSSKDVIDELKGPLAGAHLPALNPDVRDVVAPRSQTLDADTERFRNAMPGGGASG